MIECVKSGLRGFILEVSDWMALNSQVDPLKIERDRDPTETLNENSQCYTTWERADILKISKSSMENHLPHLMFIALKFGFHVS